MKRLKIAAIFLTALLVLSSCEYREIFFAEYPTHSAAAVYCIEDDKFLYSDSIDKHIAPASLTKLLTASVALQYISENTVVNVGSEQALVPEGSSICYVLPGHSLGCSSDSERYKLTNELLKNTVN